jgi:hypothetical protein
MTFYVTSANASVKGESVQSQQKKAARPKVRATLYLPADLLNEARDAAVFLAGYPVRMTLTRLAEEAFTEHIRRLKDAHNDGQDFPPRTENLKGGRPIAA